MSLSIVKKVYWQKIFTGKHQKHLKQIFKNFMYLFNYLRLYFACYNKVYFVIFIKI